MTIPTLCRVICNLLFVCALGAQIAYASRSPRQIASSTVETVVEEHLLMAIQESPIHKEILTTVFWVGERAKPRSGWSSNMDSAWDMRWKENFGGLDSPIYRKGFFPASFRPKQNPFYVALPFNDISNPGYLETCPILQFFKTKKASTRSQSICKNRWIEISYNGKVCYGQWQDVGPIYTDDYDYVFRGDTPRAHDQDMAGLDISPAIRDLLGIKSTCRTTWRFVEESQVPHGPWKAVITRS